MATEHLFDEMKRYVGFGELDEVQLRALRPRLEPHFGRCVDDFYEHILRHPAARRALAGGEAQADRLKASLRGWLEECFEGPWDVGYFDRHARTGRRHVLIQLPQHYMFVAMSVIRAQLVDVVLAGGAPPAAMRTSVQVLNRVLDLELAIMLHAYREASHAELIAAKEVAEAATRSKSDFLANMSHEIRTPMNAVIGLAYLALKTDLTPKQRDYLSKIHNAGTSLLGIINDILDVSKIEAGRLDIEVTELDLERVLSSVTNVVGQKAHDKGLELLVSVAPEVPTDLLGDPLRLGQIVTNLVSNAVKFTDRGQVRVRVALEERTGEKVKLRFTVEDTGMGMSPDQSARLFQPFVQADASTTRKHGGTGLGLTISKRLVEMMGGHIGLESKPGLGTTFHFTVWLGLASEHSGRKLFPEELSRLRVLVADDNAASRDIMTEALRDVVARVNLVSSGPEAVAAVHQNDAAEPYDVVFMDWRMPGMDGLQAAAALKSSVAIRNRPRIVIITAFGREEVRQAAEKLPVDGLLLKPMTRSMLVDSLVTLFAPQWKEGVVAPAATTNERFLAGVRLLLVEDNEINQQIAVELLEGAGASVRVVGNGRIAVELLEASAEDAFHVVLMDLQMPEMDGHQATARIRKIPRFAALPIIAMTAHATVEERQRCFEEGMNDHVSKPIDPEVLLRTVARCSLGTSTGIHTPPPPPRDGDDLGAIPGLDASDGLRRLAGNRALYRKLLVQFTGEQRDAAARIAAHIAADDNEAASRLAHTLKGVAGNLGAKTVQRVAAALETLLSAKGAVRKDEARPLVAELEARLDELVAPLAAALAPPAEPAAAPVPAAVDTADALAVVAKLRTQLSEFDSAAGDTVEANANVLRAFLSSDGFTGLEAAVRSYAFDEALALLDQLRSTQRENP